MPSERDRMLAEGPRVAPEPLIAEGSVLTSPKRQRPRPTPSTTGFQDGAWKVPRGLVRLFPLVVFGLVLAANAGAARYAVWVIVPIALGATLIRLARRGRT